MNLKGRVLIADDDPNDAMLLQRAILKVNPEATFNIARNGLQAVNYLEGDGDFANRELYPFPRLLITDLKMPRMDGFELLAWIGSQPRCNVIPKIVMSASAHSEDVIRAYQLGANIYFQKPAGFSSLVQLVELTLRLWLIAELPPDPA